MSALELGVVTALALGCAVFYAIRNEKFHRFGLREFGGFGLVFGFFFLQVLLGYWIVKQLILGLSG